jgi:4-hydroxy-3-polyprenylbenzoate decarboxylase
LFSVITAITGASGAIYALRFLQKITSIDNTKIHLIISPSAKIVFKEELGISIEDDLSIPQYLNVESDNIHCYQHNQINAPIASGSFEANAMVIIPASMGTISAIANGLSTNLIERAADVTLKEKRKLILVPRETPWSSIHLENCLKLSQNGAIILPANPSFYSKPKTIEELVDTVVFRVLQHLDKHHLFAEHKRYIYKEAN